MADRAGLEGFWQLLNTAQARVIPIPVRLCDECDAPAAVAFVFNAPAMAAATGGNTLGAAFYCEEHSDQLHAWLESTRRQEPPS